MGSVVSRAYSSSRKKILLLFIIYTPSTDTCDFYTYLSTDTDNTDNTLIGAIKNAILCF
jgi:hypothetical protein